MDTDEDLPRPRRWPLVVALLATSAWLAMAVIGSLQWNDIISIDAGFGSGVLACAALTPPLAVLWLVATRLRDRSGDRAARAALLLRHAELTDERLVRAGTALADLDSKLEALAAKLDSLTNPVDAHRQSIDAAAIAMTAAAASLNRASGETREATQALGNAAPDAITQANRLTALLAQSGGDVQRQLGETETLLAGLWTRIGEIEAGARHHTEASTARLDAIAAAGARATEALGPPVAMLTESADAALARTANAVAATRDGVHAQATALMGAVEQATAIYTQAGGDAAARIEAHLAGLSHAASALGQQLEEQEDRARTLVDAVERSFAILDAKLGNSVATSNAAMTAVEDRMTGAREAIHRLGEPIAATHAALSDVEAKVADVGAATATAVTSLGTALPDTLPHVEALTARLADLHASAQAFAAPIAAGTEAIIAADTRFTETRAALDAAALKLTAELDTARAHLADIEQLTGTASLAASSQLIEVFARVREVAAQTAGTMRTSLGAVVEEAEDALHQAGTSKAEAAFGAPVRASIAEIEAASARAADAAQLAAERVTKRLVALTGTIATVEARINEADAHYDLRLRDDIAKRSAALLDSLNGAAIDIAKLLAIDVPDTAWQAYLKGDKGIFARRTVRLIDGGTARAIARHYEHDPEFREQATRYIGEFETLIQRVLPDREGKALAVTLLSSDVGKLYVALAQAVERLR